MYFFCFVLLFFVSLLLERAKQHQLKLIILMNKQLIQSLWTPSRISGTGKDLRSLSTLHRENMITSVWCYWYLLARWPHLHHLLYCARMSAGVNQYLPTISRTIQIAACNVSFSWKYMVIIIKKIYIYIKTYIKYIYHCLCCVLVFFFLIYFLKSENKAKISIFLSQLRPITYLWL